MYENLLPIQQQFIMYLTAQAPTLETVQKHIYFELQKEEISTKDLVTTKPVVLSMQAKIQGMSVDVFKEQQNRILRKKYLDDLEVKLGFKEDEDTNGVNQLMNKYNSILERLSHRSPDQKDQTIQNLLNIPIPKKNN